MASAHQNRLSDLIDGKLTSTSLEAPLGNPDRRLKFVDDPAHDDYMYRLQKHGKVAMDKELHDASYGEASPTDRIKLAKLRTAAFQKNPRAIKALIALQRSAVSGDDAGFSLDSALHYAAMPITLPVKAAYKATKWTGQKLGLISKGGSSPEDIRLAKLRAARKRTEAAQARARAADANTEAELRAQQALASAADAEAEAADAEAAAKEEAARTKEVEANPDATFDDESGFGFGSLKKLGRGIGKGLKKSVTAPASLAKKGLGKALKKFVPNRDKQKAAMVKNLYGKLWFEHANWLAKQDQGAGLALAPRAKYDYVAKLWAKTQIKRGGLPTNFAVGRAEILGVDLLGGEIMGSWWNPLSWFSERSNVIVNQTQGQRDPNAPTDQDAVRPDQVDPESAAASADYSAPADEYRGDLLAS
jgi:hypothetical protein